MSEVDASFTFRRERRALTTVARFFAGSLGAILCGSFVLSVLRDSGDIARFAWTEGADLLGTYGGAGIIAIPFIGLLTAYLRAGRTVEVTQVAEDVRARSLFFRTSDGHTHALDAREVSATHTVPLAGGRARLVISLARGLETGDRFVFEGPAEKLALVASVTERAPRELELTRTKVHVGGLVMVLSAIVGALISYPIFNGVVGRAHALGVLTVPTADAWEIALFVASSSLVALVASIVLAARRLRFGLEGVVVRGPLSTRFIAASRLGRARTLGGALVLPVRGGVPVVIPSFGCDDATLHALVAELESARDAAKTSPPSEPIARLLGTWREAIRQPRSAGGYRDAGLPVNELVAALRSARSSDDERLGSAALMIASGEDGARAEVRRVAELMARDDSREALLELAGEEQAEAEAEAHAPLDRLSA